MKQLKLVGHLAVAQHLRYVRFESDQRCGAEALPSSVEKFARIRLCKSPDLTVPGKALSAANTLVEALDRFSGNERADV